MQHASALMAALAASAPNLGYGLHTREAGVTRLHSRADGWGNLNHTKRHTRGRPSSYQGNGWCKPGRDAARKRLRRLTGANRLGL